MLELNYELQPPAPEPVRVAAAEAAKGRKLAGYVLPLQNTTQQPALSSLKNRALRQRLLQAGFDGYLEKPIASGDLLAEIERILS